MATLIVLALLARTPSAIAQADPKIVRLIPDDSVLDVASQTPMTLRGVSVARVTLDPRGLPSLLGRIDLSILRETVELSLRRSGLRVLGDTAYPRNYGGVVVGIQVGVAEDPPGNIIVTSEIKVYQFVLIRNLSTRPALAPVWESGTAVGQGPLGSVVMRMNPQITILADRLSNAFLAANPRR